ncbi:MAG: hypothetical protein C5B49_12190, partial [Bdellovibrio sp.]
MTQDIALFFEGDDYYREAFKAIAAAQAEICLETYIFALDEIGVEFLQRLASAQKRGVAVYLLVDGVGSNTSLPALRQFCEQNEIHLRVYHPVPFLNFGPLQQPRVELRLYIALLRRINSRNHRKVIIVDRIVAFAGSLNIISVHSRKFSGEKAWRDTGMRIESPKAAIVELRNSFFRAWRRAFRWSRLLTR